MPHDPIVTEPVRVAEHLEPAFVYPEQDATAAARLAAYTKDGKRPNVLMIVFDDVGWGDFGCYGGGVAVGAATPNIDKLARQGLLLTSCYSEPSCTPSRASLLTGRLPMRHGLMRPPMYGEAGGLQGEITIAQLLADAGVPDGVVNVLPTDDASAWFDAAVDHPATRMVSFTGSTATGRSLLKRSADRVLKTVMELGGNAPFIVFDDADVDAAVSGAITAKMRHSAQTCTAANRFFVEAGVADEFTTKFAAAMGAIEVGNGFDDGVECGPLIHASKVDEVASLVDDAVDAGAEIVVGGTRRDGPGNFYETTVLRDVRPDAAITREEIFAPVAPVITFTDTDTMIDQANDTEMGLIGYVYTRDLAVGLNVSERIQAGMIGLNRGSVSDPAAPFGGMKQSGVGREGASEGIYEFCETQYIALDY